MTGREAGEEGADRTDGATTSGSGTPIAVDVGATRRSRSLLLLFVAGPLIWTTHFLFVYLVVEAGCTGDGHGLNMFDPPVPTIVTLAATGVAAAASLFGAASAFRRWRVEDEHDRQGEGSGDPPRSNSSLAFGGFLMSLLGFIVILFVGLPALALSAC